MNSENCTRIRHSLTRKLAGISKSLARALMLLEETNNAPKTIHTADLIKSVLHSIPHRADTITVPDWELNGDLIEISLDNTKTPLEYMKTLYKRAHRLIRGREKLEAEITKLKLLQENTQELITQYDSGLDIEIPPRQKAAAKIVEAKAKPFRTYLASTGEKILVGKDRESNQHISFHLAKGDDLWLHAEGVEGSHVVIKRKRDQNKSDAISPLAIEEGALLAAYFSKKRIIGTQVAVSMTKRSDLFRKKNMAPGMALMRTHSTITVELNKDRIQTLLNRQT